MKTLFGPAILFIIILAGFSFLTSGCSFLNSFQRDGTLSLESLNEPVKVIRDEKGMPYIYAKNMDDLLLAQGFVTAQDRLFLMEVTRLLAQGRISELAGEKARDLDIRMRTIGFLRNAVRQYKLLAPEEKRFFQKYIDGVNAYIQTREDTYPLEFKLAGIQPGPWTVEDSLSILFYMGWNSAANLKDEVVAQMLVDKLGREKAEEIFPITINPDDPNDTPGSQKFETAVSKPGLNLKVTADRFLPSYLNAGDLEIGSNNWAVASQSSPNNRPVVANDPHLKSGILPGTWYSCGFITPELRAAGVMVPGIPGMIIGRTDYFAIGVTNAYGDTQDLYIETIDPKNPENYLEGEVSIPFDIIEETLTIKDKEAENGLRKEKIKIRLTKRGPIVSDVLSGLKTENVLSMRWSVFEDMGPSLGFIKLLKSKNVFEIREALYDVTAINLNFVFADADGNIALQTSGRVPVRTMGNGLIPNVVTDGSDNWNGRIPFDEMPQSINPERGWVGTCNQKTVTSDFKYYYSSHLSPSYRYRRLKQLLDAPGIKTADDHWQYQRDTLNLMAVKIAPVMAEALTEVEETEDMGRILSDWDCHDDPEKAGPAVFQTVYREFALLVFSDELEEDLSKALLDNWYFWHERLGQMVAEGTSPWFDNINTLDKKESMKDIFQLAGLAAREKLADQFGQDSASWKWGDLHQMEFLSPIRREGFGKGLLGAGSYPASGSGETLYRGIYKFSDPYNVFVPASLRMVADLGDDDKVLAVLPGGITARLFDPHNDDQVEAYMNGEKMYWWYSDAAIEAHSKNVLILTPEK